jgi:hypothetical protein
MASLLWCMIVVYLNIKNTNRDKLSLKIREYFVGLLLLFFNFMLFRFWDRWFEFELFL